MPDTLEMPETGKLTTLDSSQPPNPERADTSRGATMGRLLPQETRLT